MMYTQETSFSLISSRDIGQFYYPESRDHETYLCILDYLEQHCDRIVISDPCQLEDITTLPEIKNQFAPWFIERRRTDHGARYSDGDGITQIAFYDDHHYRCCKESIDLLRSSENFITLDRFLDIRFFAGNRCVLTTIAHESIYYLDPSFFLDLAEFRLAEEKIGETVYTDYDTASNHACPYLMPALSSDEYRKLLDDLARYSDTLSLIFPGSPSPASQNLMQKLGGQLLHHNTIHNWPGRWHIDVPADEYVYSVNAETITVFKKLSDFFDADCDLSFNRSGFSVLYVLRQEEQCVQDAGFFDDPDTYLPQEIIL
ncbi:hypothetical protein [Methanorbis furvi]|uniref:Uncharacterized protein n=1 Tax=Methanorbis furvi TaxID=3028299 RepID=A0AAE4S9N3_9EURY|nr:hypothetical protein [Methanocorpusculaceae archaeon Ag1]